jgi:hypothetical protein
MMGMEHSVANMFMLPLGLICGGYAGDSFNITIGDTMAKNMIPVTIGNFVAGSVCVAASYSYAFGQLGKSGCGINDGCGCITQGCQLPELGFGRSANVEKSPSSTALNLMEAGSADGPSLEKTPSTAIVLNSGVGVDQHSLQKASRGISGVWSSG